MLKKYYIKQHDLTDCGPCCLKSIIKYYNGNIPLENIRIDTKTSKNGTSAYNLLESARKYGFNTQALKLEELTSSILLPAIAHVIMPNGLNHFVVIYKIDKKNIIIMDPAKGIVKYSLNDFYKIWTNIILILEPFTKIPYLEEKNKLKEYLLNLLNYERKNLTSIIVINIIIIILSIAVSYYYKIALSYLSSYNILMIIIISFFFINILKVLFEKIRQKKIISLNQKIDSSIFPFFINHILNLPLNAIKSRTPGEIITRTNELHSIKELFSEIFISIFLDLSLSLVVTFFLYKLSSQLFLLLCLVAILYIILSLIYNPSIYRKINDNIELETSFNSDLIEKVENLESIKNLNIVEKSCNHITNNYYNYLHNELKFSNFINDFSLLKNLIYDLGIFLISSYGIYLIYMEKLDFTSLVVFDSLLLYFIEPLQNILNLIPKYNYIKLSITKINEFLNIIPEENKIEEEFSNGDIIFNNISYSYNNNQYILNNINLRIKENDHLILEGSSGQGKSTLCKLLNRNLDDYEGNISINDINIKDYNLNTIRSNITYISQNEKIFTDTIKNNIELDKNLSIEELNEISHITKVDEIINKKKLRYDSILFDSGYNLSGGERQRLILARALARKPKILILDESLSEVDSIKRKEILKNLDTYLDKTTIIYISHNENNYFRTKIKL